MSDDRDLWVEFLDLPELAVSHLAGALVDYMLNADPATLARLLDETAAVTR